MTITGIGEIVLDIVLKQLQPQAAVPGGSTFNAMVSLGRTAGRDCPDIKLQMVSQLGDDSLGDIIATFMQQNHIGTDALVRVKGQSSIALAMLDEGNNASYEFFRDPNPPAFEVPELEFKKGDILLFGSFFAINPATRDQVRQLVRKAREAGALVYYDINFRKNHSTHDSLPQIEQNIALSDMVRGSSDDIAALYGTVDAASVYQKHIAPLCKHFICTRGARETEVFSPGIHRTYPVPQGAKVVSTIGAGDNFNAGSIYALVKSKNFEWDTIVATAHRFSQNVVASLYNYVDEDFILT